MILSIESSCDDSSIAVTDIVTKEILFHRKISQEAEHAKYGGVVPELASRLHAVDLPKLLEEAKPYLDDLKAVAVTNAPGLSVTLLEGVAMAQALSIAKGLPIIPINHLKAHIYSLFIEKEAIFPMLVLLISGGHTMVLDVESFDEITVVATTMDDSFGESFDKVAKMMGLGYPGGPVIEKLAQKGDPDRFPMPIPLQHSPKIAFSYSGIKNAVRLVVEANQPLDEQTKADIAASFQKAAIAHLMQKTKKIFATLKPKDFAIVGGASANMAVREAFANLCARFDCNLHLADLQYCSDNAAMVGRCAIDAYYMERFSDALTIEVSPRTDNIS
ncbi:tRNA (adenosine(37)-N6)-threonylcarbamoyltransferase complex transferase subunit TsaD [Hydrogenimonas cancrithermarum]|uniref:tRNA N6-adenosine threonylcarbamoyltransferase n=1 Tax=Hydrogenimonas cancrithermarum TaxID=2993563 RepID=A0ABN6WXQ0_9BACT|nr:tRNA (adenosine(37)-N6)-threonylcarbamoyltransferase complex transferase subunit TsaD [Hydrogenimonas cancrithermarum]BDY12872.1 tRNA N6-adenosine threonylcarbamoyltransferase [Hydrogenimonas cancrithermarum]BDY12989.1 tRNA N6-adenosine threonylcarbamoyltransferase [Hydrogenimonas cancrithermarum]